MRCWCHFDAFALFEWTKKRRLLDTKKHLCHPGCKCGFIICARCLPQFTFCQLAQIAFLETGRRESSASELRCNATLHPTFVSRFRINTAILDHKQMFCTTVELRNDETCIVPVFPAGRLRSWGVDGGGVQSFISRASSLAANLISRPLTRPDSTRSSAHISCPHPPYREDAELGERAVLDRAALPTTVEGFKRHPTYTLQRHVGRYQALRPGVKSVGLHRRAPLLRQCAVGMSPPGVWSLGWLRRLDRRFGDFSSFSVLGGSNGKCVGLHGHVPGMLGLRHVRCMRCELIAAANGLLCVLWCRRPLISAQLCIKQSRKSGMMQHRKL